MANVMNLAGVDPATVGLVQSYNVSIHYFIII